MPSVDALLADFEPTLKEIDAALAGLGEDDA